MIKLATSLAMLILMLAASKWILRRTGFAHFADAY